MEPPIKKPIIHKMVLYVCIVAIVAMVCGTLLWIKEIEHDFKLEQLRAEVGQVKVYSKPYKIKKKRWTRKRRK